MKMYTEEGNLDWVFNNTVSRWPVCVWLRLTEPILADSSPQPVFLYATRSSFRRSIARTRDTLAPTQQTRTW